MLKMVNKQWQLKVAGSFEVHTLEWRQSNAAHRTFRSLRRKSENIGDKDALAAANGEKNISSA